MKDLGINRSIIVSPPLKLEPDPEASNLVASTTLYSESTRAMLCLVHGFVEDASGNKHATLLGKWDDSMYYIKKVANVKPEDVGNANLLWQRTMPPTNLTRYNLTSLYIKLNKLIPGLQVKEKLPPTNSRLRLDQRHLENGEYDMANS